MFFEANLMKFDEFLMKTPFDFTYFLCFLFTFDEFLIESR